MIKPVELENEEHTLRGMLHMPDETTGPIPCVILFHGFTGYKEEVHFMFVKMSRVLQRSGIASLRFDFSGSGDSDGEFVEMTVSSEYSDAQDILDYTKQLDWVNKTKISLLGMSMGGAIAGMLAAANESSIYKLCLWAPGGDLRTNLYNFIHSCTGLSPEEIRNSETIDVLGNVIGSGLIENLENLDVFQSSKGFNKPVMIIHGDNDDVVPISDSHRYLDIYGENASLAVISGARHIFDSELWEKEVLNRTLEFLAD